MATEAARLYVSVDGRISSLERALATAEQKTKATANVTDKQTTRMAGTWTKVGSAAKSAGLIAGTAFIGLGIKKAADEVIGFDKAMRNVNSIAQLSEGRFASLSDEVLGLAGKTAQAPITLAQGLYDLVSSGFDANQSLRILQKSAKAATAGLTTTEVSTKAVAAVLNAYKLPASQAGKVSDQLFRTVDRGVISFESLAQNIGDVLPFSASLGVGLDQVGAAIASMTKAGVSGPETMTRIKGAMVALIRPSEDLKKVYKELGVASGEQLIQKTGSLQGALEALAKTTGGNKEALAKLFPDIRGLSGALLLTGGNAKSAGKDLEGLRNSAGATDRALSQQQKSISGQWQKITAEAKTLAIQVGSVAVPAILAALLQVAPAAGHVADAFEAVTHSGPGMAALGAIVGGLAGRMAFLAGAFAVGKVLAWTSTLRTAISITTSLRGAMALLTASMAVNPFGAVAVVIGAVVGALGLLSLKTDAATVSQQAFRDAILGVRDALDRYKDAGNTVKDAQLRHKGATIALLAAEKNLKDLRKSGTATALELKQAEHDVAEAKNEVGKSSKEEARAERDVGANKKKAIADAREEINTIRERVTSSARLVGKLILEGASHGQVAAAMDQANGEALSLKQAQLELARATDAPIGKIRRLRAEIAALRSKTITVTLVNRQVGKSVGGNSGQGAIYRASGGGIPGYGGGDKVPAWLERGEHIIDKETVKRMGGHRFFDAMRGYKDGGAVAAGKKGGRFTPKPRQWLRLPADDLEQQADSAKNRWQSARDRAASAKGKDKATLQAKVGPLKAAFERKKAIAAKARQFADRIAKQEDLVEIAGAQMTLYDKQGKDGAYNKAKKRRMNALGALEGLLSTAMRFSPDGSKFQREVKKQLLQVRNDATDLKGEAPTTPAPELLTGAEQGTLSAIEADAALAALTDPTGDDQAAQARLVSFWEGVLGRVQQGGNLDFITQAAQNLKSARDQLGGLTGAASTSQDPDLRAQLDQANARYAAAKEDARLSQAWVTSQETGGTHVHFHSVVPTTAAQAAEAAGTVVRGIDSQGNRISPRRLVNI